MFARSVFSVLIGVGLLSVAVEAQYFGRNKVRYEDFAFQVLQTPHFDIYYYPAEQQAVEIVAPLAERWYERLSAALDHTFDERQPLVLYASHSHFIQTTVIPGTIGEGVGGITEHARGRVVMPFAAGLRETDHILGHELVHAFQRDILRKQKRSIALLPLWFIEGMAEHVSVGRIDPHTSMWIRDAARNGTLPSLAELNDPKFFPYRYGQALWSFLAATYGEAVVARSLKSPAAGGAIGRLSAVTGETPEALSAAWHAFLQTHADAVVATKSSSEPLIRPNGRSRLNVAPSLSPDGREIVFLSERDQYSIDVYLADARTGAIKRRLIRTAADPHFESLQFIGSAGAWDPGGRRFAMTAVRRGRPVMTILDMPSGERWREIGLEHVDEAFTPAWSPDGSQLVFSGMRGGLVDLFVVELEAGRVRALTEDAYAELHPSWSPDGKTIAFATDRFSASFAERRFGEYGLATLDVASRAVAALPGPAAGKAIDPEWSADGKSLYFISDSDGASNVYRLAIATGLLFRVTGVDTGVSGITAASPALSVAESGRIAFSVYRGGAYEIHATDDAAGVLAGTAHHASTDAVATAPVPVPAAFTTKPYDPGLQLDRIGQPYLSAGGGSFGSFVTAGMSFSFGDTLGEHLVHTAFQGGKSLDDMALQVAYFNRQSRWNWVVAGDRLPTRFRVTRSTVSGTDGAEPLVRREELMYRQMHHRLGMAAIYPFDRSRRIEFRGSMHAIEFGRSALTTVHSATTGDLISESENGGASAESLMLGEFGAAYVYDSTLHGPTGPLLGRRYRVDVSPTVGSMTLATITADYRRYVMPVKPYTLAVRLRHLGRVGGSAGDARLLPLAYDLRDIARGFSHRELAASACAGNHSAACAASQYFNTRHVSAFNVELRLPLTAAWRREASYGPVPVDAFGFFDQAWLGDRAGDRSQWRWRPLQSAGAGVRVNARGFVVEAAAAHRFSQVSRGWTFAFNLRPAF